MRIPESNFSEMQMRPYSTVVCLDFDIRLRSTEYILTTSWEMAETEQKLARDKKTRIELLQDALEGACICNQSGHWVECAKEVRTKRQSRS